MKIKLKLFIRQETMISHKTYDMFYIIALFCNSVTRKKRFERFKKDLKYFNLFEKNT